MYKKLLYLVVISTLIVLNFTSCNKKEVSLQSTTAKGEVPMIGNLNFIFNKSLMPDSLLNNWDSSDYITFTPEIKGRFRWKSPDELIFSPAADLLPATSYSARINNEVLKFSKYNSIDKSDIKFYTAPLQFTDVQVTWVLKEDAGKSAAPQAHLFFNYEVSAEDLKNKTEIMTDGKKTGFTLKTSGNSREIILLLENVAVEDKNIEAGIKIAKGLVPAKGKNPTEEILQSSINIPPPFNLVINNVESEHDGTQGVVRIYTSQQVTGNISPSLAFDPSVPVTIQYEDNAVIIRSDKFEADKSYSFTVKKGIRGKVGGVLREDYSGNVAFGQLESAVKFTNNKAIYLAKNGSGNIEVRITNTPKVKVVISRIYENNLLMAERYGYYPDEGSEENYDEEEYYGGGNAMAGDIVYSKEIDTRTLPKSGTGRLLNLSNFEDRLPDAKGIYHVMIRSAEDYWIRDSRFISYSDIGLITKAGKEKVFVFASSINTSKPIAGVTINIYGSNNQLAGTASTGNDGVAEIKLSNRGIEGFKPAMVIAKTENDFTYLPFNNTRVNTSRFDVGGKNNSSVLDAFVYSERDIYRPGEKVNFAVVLRDAGWRPPGEIPLKFVFLMPNGKELRSFRKTINEQGMAEGSIDISQAAITGSYSLEVFSSTNILLASKNFMIEEFVPDRIKVETKLNQADYRTGENASVNVTAINFFGPPAANRNYEVEMQVRQKNFTSKKFPGYNFSLANPRDFFDKVLKEGKTNEKGQATEIFEIPAMYQNSGLLQANFYTTVFDETGRPVSRHSSAEIVTQPVFFGIKENGYNYYPLNSAVTFNLAGVNKNGEPVKSVAKVQVIRHEYKTILTRSRQSYFRYESQKETKIISEQEVSISPNTVFSFVPRSPGDYELRVYAPGANAYVKRSFYSYGSWGGDNNSFEVNTEGQIDIELDKENYSTGEKARVLFKTPFSGSLLVTLETDHVISYHFAEALKRTATLELDINPEHLPNVYITATLIKPHTLSDIPLTVAHGFKNITVEEKKRKLPVEIIAATSARSATFQTIKVRTSPGSFVTLAAVDNGVLQINDFKTPDPYNYFYQKKALQVNAYDLYPLLFPEIRQRLSSTGGDGDINLDKRINPMQAKRFRIMSYWSGIKKTGGDGIAEFKVEIPKFNGQVRLMAVAVKNENFGSSEKNLTIADPVIISTALPRFISPGDTVLVPVTLSNTTARNASGEIAIRVKGPIKVSGESKRSVSMPANAETNLLFKVYAETSIGIANVTVEANALSEKFSEVTEISIRPASTLQKISGSGSVIGGSVQKINILSGDLIPSTFSYDVLISKSPMAEMADQMKYLVQYPYGCTEQVVSSVFPQLYYGDLADVMGLKQDKNSAENVIESIRKIKMRQLYNGGLLMWDGEGTENWWATTYAAHFLLEAKKAGFDVDNSLMETILGYLVNKLRTKQTINYIYNRDQNKKIAPKEVPYSLYVLALAGRTQVSSMNYYKSNPQLLALDGKYLLSAAYAVAGDKRSFAAMLPGSFSGEEAVQETGGSFYSLLRDEALSLNALMDVDPGNKQVPFMARHISGLLKTEKYPNTQERAFTFLALGKLARQAAQSNVTGIISASGKQLAEVKGNWKSNSNSLKTNSFDIKAQGTGRLYYSWIAEGISKTGNYTEEDNYIKVRRKFFDRNGNAINGNVFKQNDLVIVEITLTKTFSSSIENIVITDLLPAGFEIENPRTKEIPGMNWIKNASDPTHLDVRDDRIHFFVDSHSGTQKYYYAVRAVSPGTFRQGPVSADAMYNGEIHSYHGAGVIRIAQSR